VGLILTAVCISPSAFATTSTLAPPSSINAACRYDVSKQLQTWFAGLPSNSTVTVASGACYLINEGIVLRGVHGLSISGGTWRNTDPKAPNPFFWLASQNICTNGPCNGHGPWVRTVPSMRIRLLNMTVIGAEDRAYGYEANGSFVRSDGVVGLTIYNVTVSHPTGDGINLEPLRAPSGSGHIVHGTEGVRVTDFRVNAPGRVGVAPVSVEDAVFTNVWVTKPGNQAWDFEADQDNEGAQYVVVNGFYGACGVVISANAAFTGPITMSGCTMTGYGASQILFIRSLTGAPFAGPVTFEDIAWRCHGAGSGHQCLTLQGAGGLVVQNSSITMTHPAPVYVAQAESAVTFLDDDVSGYTTPGVSMRSIVTVTGGIWSPEANAGFPVPNGVPPDGGPPAIASQVPLPLLLPLAGAATLIGCLVVRWGRRKRLVGGATESHGEMTDTEVPNAGVIGNLCSVGEHPPGWYEDPKVPQQVRWWDGEHWSMEHVRPRRPALAPPPQSVPQVSPGPGWRQVPEGKWSLARQRIVAIDREQIMALLLGLQAIEGQLGDLGDDLRRILGEEGAGWCRAEPIFTTSPPAKARCRTPGVDPGAVKRHDRGAVSPRAIVRQRGRGVLALAWALWSSDWRAYWSEFGATVRAPSR